MLPTIPDFLAHYLPDPAQRTIAYAIMYSILGMVQAYIFKTRLHIEKPKNALNLITWGVLAFCIARTEGIPEGVTLIVIAGTVGTTFLAYRLFHINLATVYVIESPKQNVIVEHEVFYMRTGTLCVALQDNMNTFKRLFLGRHVAVDVTCTTKWTEDYETQLWICNSYLITEENMNLTENEEPQQGIRARLSNLLLGQKIIVMHLDVCDAHEVSRWELVQDTAVLDMLVQKYEKVSLAYTKLRTLLTAMLVRKQSRVLISALKTFEDAIYITDAERAQINKIEQKVKDEKKGLEDKTLMKPESKQAKGESVRTKVQYTNE